MLYSIKRRDEMEKLDELVSLQNRVKASRLQDKLEKRNFHEGLKKAFEPVYETVKDASE